MGKDAVEGLCVKKGFSVRLLVCVIWSINKKGVLIE